MSGGWVLVVLVWLTMRRVRRGVVGWIYRWTRSKRMTLYAYAALFWPGTVVHELMHWIVAKVLWVPVSEPRLWPRWEGGEMLLGEVRIAKVGWLRRSLVAVAPLVLGLGMMAVMLRVWERMLIGGRWEEWVVLTFVIVQVASATLLSRGDLKGIVGICKKV